MKKFILLLAIAIISTQSTQAANLTKYFDQGRIYSGSSFPVDVAKNANDNTPPIESLKCGEASSSNVLGLIEIGDRGIQKAAQNGGIKKIYYVDTKINKVYVPLIFIPFYIKEITTKVYGE